MVGTPFRHPLPAMSVEDRIQSRLVQVREAIAIGEEQLLLALALNHEGEIERPGRFVRELRAWQDLIQLAVEASAWRTPAKPSPAPRLRQTTRLPHLWRNGFIPPFQIASSYLHSLRDSMDVA